jgi:hypothetical protein
MAIHREGFKSGEMTELFSVTFLQHLPVRASSALFAGRFSQRGSSLWAGAFWLEPFDIAEMAL